MNTELWRWIGGAAVVVLSWPVGRLIARLVCAMISRWSEQTETKVDDIITAVFKKHLAFWFFLAGLYLASHLLPAIPGRAGAIFHKGLLAGWILSIALAVSEFTIEGLRLYIGTNNIDLPKTSLLENILRLAIVGLGILMLLSNLGISITPVLTALGVGSLAVALAFQDTLTNLFAGLYTIINRQIHVGDFIELDSGEKGEVLDIGWRTTRLKALANNVILVANSKLASAIVTNYNEPSPDLAVLIGLGVSYDSDLAKVEAVTVETAREVLKSVPGGVPDYEPLVRFHTFGESSVDFTVVLKAKTFVDQYLLKHEFVKKLHARYAKEGIEIPFPQRVLHQSKS
ncbi:MAG: mechanosensitive ion channel family protein [Elusimicrobia bacterium]|nr:mechanosensitive ion channel family protein [Elusimicrobiota bacterium]